MISHSRKYLWAISLSLVFVLAGVGPASGQAYPVDSLIFTYETDRDDLPPVSLFLDLRIPLSVQGGVYMPAREDGTPVTLQLDAIPAGASFSNEALQEILDRVVRTLNEQDIYSVYVIPDRAQIDPRNGRDRRRAGNRSLNIDIFVGQIQDLQSVAKGDRIDLDESRPINAPEHSRILRNSPLGQRASGADLPDLFRRNQLEDYLRRLNRHPGRRVDATIAASDEPGLIDLHYLVTESKPWIAYGQASNTGTETVGEWQYRVGYTNYQATGNDDILTVDYVAADPELSYTGVVSYTYPILFPDYLSFSVFGSYSKFTGDEFGVGNTQLNFGGETWLTGGELRASPFETFGFAHDFFVGLQWQDTQVFQTFRLSPEAEPLPATEGQARFRTLYAGYGISRYTRPMNTNASIRLEGNLDGVSEAELDNLGRLFSEGSWFITKWDIQQSFYLEPLLFPERWRDTDSWKTSTLANEIAFNVGGQVVISNDRVIPQKQSVIGGLYSVRGYPQSVAAADHGWYIQAEYRLHIPRLLKPYSSFDRSDRPRQLAGRYNLRAPRPLTNPDWDFIVRVFTDFGQTENEIIPEDGAIADFETDQELWGGGIGLELQVLNYLNLRLDVAQVFAGLEEFDAGTSQSRPIDGAESGDVRVHFLGTISW